MAWPTIPNTFVSGTKARSSEVNANFEAVQDAIGGYDTITSADYTITDTDGLRVVLGSTGNTTRTFTLPTLADNLGRIISIKKIDSGTGSIVIEGEGAETIDGGANVTLLGQYDFLTVQAAAGGWNIIATSGPLGGTASLAKRKVYTFSFANTTTCDVTISADGFNSRTSVAQPFSDTSTANWADAGYTVERPTTTTFRFRSGSTISTANIKAVVLG